MFKKLIQISLFFLNVLFNGSNTLDVTIHYTYGNKKLSEENWWSNSANERERFQQQSLLEETWNGKINLPLQLNWKVAAGEANWDHLLTFRN